MLEHFGVTIKLTSPHPAEDLRVQLWTNALTKLNPNGNWYALDLNHRETTSEVHIFEHSLMPTSVGDYEFTYRVGLKSNPDRWQWIGQLGKNGYLKVEPPSPSMKWTQGASAVEVFENVYVGNFIAASSAEELGFDAVLNLAEELILTFSPESKILYKKMGLFDGAHHSIADSNLTDAVRWIEEQVRQGKKILIHCRAGIGRSGSVGVAYCFFRNPQWSYPQTLEYIWSKKPDIYPHKNFQESLEKLFPRS